MATSGDLARVVAQSFNLPEATVANCYRALREADMVPKAGRGPRSGVPVSSETAAKLLIALCGSSYEKEPPPKVLEKFLGLRAWWADFQDGKMNERAQCEPGFRLSDFSLPCLEALAPGHSFLEGLTAIIETAARGEFPFKQKGVHRIPNDVTLGVEISAAPNRRATIDIMINGAKGRSANATVEYRHEDDEKMDREEMMAHLVNADLSIVRSFRVPTIISLGELLSKAPPGDVSPAAQAIIDRVDVLKKVMNQKANSVLESGSMEEKQKFKVELRKAMRALEELHEEFSDEE